ncbi:hypothetical protein [Roseimicrobium sp. ORNL1]|uniref:hypothetical protein n=1 Tax=Roseimicrobium sp. ORNL1 TaxID=2711231 RepID=UPI0013E199C6|nr:hypothetical protein [Roseimicrobium sp. ORNL1]QIF04335.1 hypothetical protein G5S37_23355 [Roseimicrobium sp. ORNL1]
MNLPTLANPFFMVLLAIAIFGMAPHAWSDDKACKAIVDSLESEVGKFRLLQTTDHGSGAGSSATFAYTAGPRADVTVFIYDRNREALTDEYLEAEFNHSHKQVVADFTGKNDFTVVSAGKPATQTDTFTFESIYAMTLSNGIKLNNATLLSRHGGKFLKIAVAAKPETFPELRPHLKELEKHFVQRITPNPSR